MKTTKLLLAFAITLVSITIMHPNSGWARIDTQSKDGKVLASNPLADITSVDLDLAGSKKSALSLQAVLPVTQSSLTPIEFTPFTAEEIGASDSMVSFTKNDGTAVTISRTQYLDEINQVEKALNEVGVTLRDTANEAKILKVVTEGSLSGINTSYKTDGNNSSKSKSAKHASGINIPAGGAVMPNSRYDEGETICVSNSYESEMDTYGVEVGDKDLIKFSSTLDMAAEGDDLKIEQTSDHTTSLWFFGNEHVLAEFHSTASNDLQSGNKSGTFTLDLDGENKINDTYSASKNPEMSNDDVSKTWSASKTLRLWATGIPINLNFELSGELGFQYTQDFTANGIHLDEGPTFNLDLTGTASVDLLVVEAAVVVDLHVLDSDLTFTENTDVDGYSGVASKQLGGLETKMPDGLTRAGVSPTYKTEYKGTANATILSGEVYVRLTIHRLVHDDNVYKISIMEWPGKTLSSEIFSDSDSMDVYTNAEVCRMPGY